MKRGFTWLVLPIALVLPGCLAGKTHVTLQQFGSMREVLHDGDTRARVRLDYVTRPGGTFAVGALEGLAGEILILNDTSWVSSVNSDGTQRTGVVAASEHYATLIVATNVASWDELIIEHDVQPDRLEERILRAAQEAGKDLTRPLPFLIEGELSDIALHIVNKICPKKALESGVTTLPYRGTRSRARGVVFGIFSIDSAGVLTHQGTRIHAHVLIPGEEPLMGHVDSFGVLSGTRIRFPREYRLLH